MIETTIIFAAIGLLGASSLAAGKVLNNRRNPAPNDEQLLNGLGYGVTIGGAFVTLCELLPPYLLS
ncbi:hypothetical protein [Salipiger bermudensis]|uniref:hypothetical protein n=1 Tax=Salipiger bermudensis TaxID=344736 RepID=UPI001CD55EB4|nr:hypothetical protein [Salipiger bermudensis]MCA0964980.1 hypothetical protein [Salipiger bermudensis]